MNWSIRYNISKLGMPLIDRIPEGASRDPDRRTEPISRPLHLLRPLLEPPSMYVNRYLENYGESNDQIPLDEHHLLVSKIIGAWQKPDTMFDIYRAVNNGKKDIYKNDWVTLSPTLAQSHVLRQKSKGDSSPWEVLHEQVPAGQLHSIFMHQSSVGNAIRPKYLDFLWNPEIHPHWLENPGQYEQISNARLD